MATGFIPTRLEKLISYIIHRIGHELGGIELAKITFLVDVEKLRFKGSTVTGDPPELR
jgi:hypothetical protein